MAGAVELSGVCAGYPEPHPELERERRDVLHEVTLRVERGGLCALLGPNGSGKSTLLRVVAGLLPPRRGTVSWLGRPAASGDRKGRAQVVALVPQRSELAFGFTVQEVVTMGRAPHQGPWLRLRRVDREAVARALADGELEHLAGRPYAELSGGEQQRVQVARALAQEPSILLLDEAAAHLDVRHAARLYALLGRQIEARGLTCLAAMHDFNAALAHATQAVVLDGGRVAGVGPTAEVLEPELLSRVFGVPIVRGALPGGEPVLAVERRGRE